MLFFSICEERLCLFRPQLSVVSLHTPHSGSSLCFTSSQSDQRVLCVWCEHMRMRVEEEGQKQMSRHPALFITGCERNDGREEEPDQSLLGGPGLT